MDQYDATRMRGGASDIRGELKTYTAAKEDIDNIVTTLRNNWKDGNNDSFTQKYNTQAKVSAENVQSLMEAFASLLESSAESWDKLYNSTSNDING